MGNVGHEIMVNKLAQIGRLIERKASRQAEGRVTEILFNTVQGALLSTDMRGRSQRPSTTEC